jgi:peptide/nickel transport system substrate-binding protein
MDGNYKIQPQMLAGAVSEDDGRRWKLTLREGLVFHDGQRVMARDCVASIRRWAARDALGSTLMASTDELSAPDDRTIQFRLKKKFPRLPYALGKTSTHVRDDAGAAGADRSVQASDGIDRQRTVPFEGGRTGVRRTDGL